MMARQGQSDANRVRIGFEGIDSMRSQQADAFSTRAK
jgi:hypothetical protein